MIGLVLFGLSFFSGNEIEKYEVLVLERNLVETRHRTFEQWIFWKEVNGHLEASGWTFVRSSDSLCKEDKVWRRGTIEVHYKAYARTKSNYDPEVVKRAPLKRTIKIKERGR